jgi:FkbM family methyltransferase
MKNKFGEFTIVEQQVNAYGGVVTDHSFSSIAIKESYLTKTNLSLSDLKTKKIQVEIRRLDSILQDLNIDTVDILSIDVEGWELDVMLGLDTEKINCKLIVVENFLNDIEYNNYFEKIGYVLKQEINYNQIYVKKDVLFTI